MMIWITETHELRMQQQVAHYGAMKTLILRYPHIQKYALVPALLDEVLQLILIFLYTLSLE